MAKLFIILLFLHIICDFYLQDHNMCKMKFEKGACGTSMYAHAFIIFIVPVIFFFLIHLICYWGNAFRIKEGFILGTMLGLVLGGTHLIIDSIKSKIEKKTIGDTIIHNGPYELWTFLGDQFLHIAIIFLAAYSMHHNGWKNPPVIESLGFQNLMFILMFLICGKPANILTRRLLIYHHIIKRDQNDDATSPINNEKPKTGQIIGAIERRLIIFFMFIGQFSAIGFFVTAKSILRFNDIKNEEQTGNKRINIKGHLTDTSEYVLVGTFISISIAILCGYLVMIADKGGVLLDFYFWLKK